MTVMRRSELLVLLAQTTRQDQQDSEAVFETSEAFLAHDPTSSIVNYFIIPVSLFHTLHWFCNPSDV